MAEKRRSNRQIVAVPVIKRERHRAPWEGASTSEIVQRRAQVDDMAEPSNDLQLVVETLRPCSRARWEAPGGLHVVPTEDQELLMFAPLHHSARCRLARCD